MGAPNLVLQEEEDEEAKKDWNCVGEDWIVWDKSLEFREFWNIDKCVPIENVAIASTNSGSSSQNYDDNWRRREWLII